jgi:hypothetical protein
MDDVLPLIMQAYCTPTCAQLPVESVIESSYPTLFEHIRRIACDASLVSKKWRIVALAAQRTAAKAMRESFFVAVVECFRAKCLDTMLGPERCVLRHAGVLTTVVILTIRPSWPPLCQINMRHLPVNAEQIPLVKVGTQETFVRLKEMPHIGMRPDKRSEQATKEAQDWLNDHAPLVLQILRQDFATLNKRDWFKDI